VNAQPEQTPLNTHYYVREDAPKISPVDRTRIIEARRLASSVCDNIWHGWTAAPMAILLVTPDVEFLFAHPKATYDFDLAGDEQQLGGKYYFRKRIFQTGFLATFPAVNAIPTIVVGQAENTTMKTSTPWVVVLLHEYFHAFQYSQSWYYPKTADLGLARGDQTGMWMLNYPFPYDSAKIAQQFSVLCKTLSEALKPLPEKDFRKALAAFKSTRTKFCSMLTPDDYRYFSFQVWQEGIARYTELRVAQAAASHFQASEKYKQLKDFSPFDMYAKKMNDQLLIDCPRLSLSELKRVAFYTYGACEALLMDKVHLGWQKEYFEKPFYIEKYY
jgi:hypothetical protein